MVQTFAARRSNGGKARPSPKRATPQGNGVRSRPVFGNTPSTKIRAAPTPDNAFYMEPVNLRARQMSIAQTDSVTVGIQTKFCHDQKTWMQDDNPNANFRAVWAIPGTYVASASNNAVKYQDQRGNVVEISEVSVDFKNQTKQDLTVMVTTPIAVLGTQLIANRLAGTEYTIPPGKVAHHRIRGFGDRDNMFGPLIGKTTGTGPGGASVPNQSIAAFDFCAAVKQVSEATGETFAPEQEALSVSMKIGYVVDRSQLQQDFTTEALRLFDTPPISIQQLPNKKAITYVDTQFAGLRGRNNRARVARKLLEGGSVLAEPSPPKWVGFEVADQASFYTAYPVGWNDEGAKLCLYNCNANGKLDGKVKLTPYIEGYRVITPGLQIIKSAYRPVSAYNSWIWDEEDEGWMLENPQQHQHIARDKYWVVEQEWAMPVVGVSSGVWVQKKHPASARSVEDAVEARWIVSALFAVLGVVTEVWQGYKKAGGAFVF